MAAYLYVMRSSLTGRHSVGATRSLDENFARSIERSDTMPESDGPWQCVYIEVYNRMEDAKDRVKSLNSLEDPDRGVQLLYTSRISNRNGE
jgi:hypothetical protein